MTTIRVKKDARYFSASNEPFVDTRLSWESRGLMGYLLSKPNDWQVRMNDLEKQGPAGSRKIKRMLAELRACGYMNRIRIKKENGSFDWITEVYESPSQNPSPSKGFTKSSGAKRTSALPTSAKPPDIDITDLPSTDIEDEEETDPKTQNLFSVYESEIGIITPIIADAIEDWSKTLPEKWVRDAIAEAAKNNARAWSYVEAILKRWKAQGNQEPMKAKANGNGKHKPAVQTQQPSDDGFMAELELKRARVRAQMQGAK